VDGNGLIDIDEFMQFMLTNKDGSSKNSQEAINQIKSAKALSVKDVIQIFRRMPLHYTQSVVNS